VGPKTEHIYYVIYSTGSGAVTVCVVRGLPDTPEIRLGVSDTPQSWFTLWLVIIVF